MNKQQGSVKRLRRRGNKGSKTSGDNSAESKFHRHLKKALRHRF